MALGDCFDDFGWEEACLLAGVAGIIEEEALDEAERRRLDYEALYEADHDGEREQDF